MISRTIALKSATALALVLCAAPAFAQDTSPPQSDETPAEGEIVVVGQRASLGAAAKIKQDSANVVDSIVADDIGKFPDRTVAGALQRVPGVQVTVGGNNEIVGPIIRGLGDIMTTLDGREIFTGVGRGFAYQDLPAEALAGADVYKTSSANLIEGGVVGAIDLRLHKPFDFKGFTVAANARGIYSKNTNKVSPIAGLLVSDRWDTGAGEIGALLDVSYASTDFNRPIAFNCDYRSGNHGPNPVAGGSAGLAAPTCVGGLNNEGNYRRIQTNGAIQWKMSPEFQVDLTGLYTSYASKWASIFLIDDLFGGPFSNVQATSDCNPYDVGADGFYANPYTATGPNPAVHRETLCTAQSMTVGSHGGFTSTQAHNDRTDLFLGAVSAKYEAGSLMLKGDVSYQRSLIRNQNFILDTLKVGGGMVSTITNLNDDGGTVYSSPGLSNPVNFGLSPLNQDSIREKGSEFAAKFDGAYQVGSILKEIQFGARFADHKADHQQAVIGTCGTVCNTLITNVSFLPAGFMIHSSGIPTVNNGLGVVAPDQDMLRDPAIQDQLRTYYGLAKGWPAFQPERAFNAEEKTLSGYVQLAYDIPLGGAVSIDGLVGARYTHTTRDIRGAALVTPAATPANPTPAAVVTPYTASTDDNDFMPNASARLRLGGGLQARLSYAKAIARPSFGSLNPGLSYLISTNILILPAGSGGNPDLKPQKSDSFDATLEYYFGRDSYISVAGYYKNITDRVISQSQVEAINGFNYNITRPRNVGKVTLKGVEVAGQAFFDFLPGAFSGLGMMANFTLADSEIKEDVDARMLGQSIQGVSKYNFTVGALYEKYGVTGRVVYTHRSSYYDEIYGGTTIRPAQGPITSLQPNPLVLNMVRPGGRLDASLGFDVAKGITLSVDATNITKNNYRSYYGRPEFPRDHRFDDTTYSVGVSAKF
ncbi:TonB-dependent receptor [Sphingomonas sp. R-74633]|uniref:TonB-dependent receptor n=1 Tax=Sphingomonas sp. R-74633 TaxID=2751188 RepID=UPI0015D0F307|nr:TonB-dependent receptor [Sphingomonas sp. R-74633]NYT40709.1 TonB-dependent receptor [Sphingomonas sp. R-74633]